LEQNFHVRHRLERYRADRAVDYEQASPRALAELIANEVVAMSTIARSRPMVRHGRLA
jgi:hypothetical protein